MGTLAHVWALLLMYGHSRSHELLLSVITGKIEFTWQEVMIGFESSLLMFPINLLIVQIFRHVRPKPTKESSEKAGTNCTSQTEKKSSSPIVSTSALTPDAVLKVQ